MCAIERRVDGVARTDAASTTALEEIDRRRHDSRDRRAHQPQSDPAAGPLVPVEISAEAGGKPDGERDDTVRRGDRINRVGADQVADETNAAADPWAGGDPGQDGADRIEKERQVKRDGDGMAGEVEPEAGQDQDHANLVQAEPPWTTPAGGLDR